MVIPPRPVLLTLLYMPLDLAAHDKRRSGRNAAANIINHPMFEMENPMLQKTTRTTIAALFVLAMGASALSVPAYAYDENSTAAVNVDAKGIALRGYDPVAYFTAKAPTMGNAQFSAKHDGMTFHFSSAANRDMFKANPCQVRATVRRFLRHGRGAGKETGWRPGSMAGGRRRQAVPERQ